jgi:TIR domain-containing protein
MVLTHLPVLARRAGDHPILALAAFVVAAATQYWATQIIASAELPERIAVAAGEEVVLGGLGDDPRLLSLEVRGSLDVRFDRARLAPLTTLLLQQAGVAVPAAEGPVAWLSASREAVPSVLEVAPAESGAGPRVLRLWVLPDPGAGVARLEVDGDSALAVSLGAGQVGARKRLVLGEQEVAVDGALPVQLAVPPGASWRFALSVAEPGASAGLTPGTLREGREGAAGLPVASLGVRQPNQPYTTFACAARPGAWLWRGARALGRGACGTTQTALRLVAVELAPERLELGLVGHAWQWRDGRPAGTHLLARLSANPALLALLLVADGVLAGWLALALLNLRRHGRYRVFISYRRGDSAGHAGRLRDCLVDSLGREAVFMDVEDIPAGARFEQVIAGRIRAAPSVVVVISRFWLTAADEAGRRRLDDPADWVRRELEMALALGKRVIPVLLGGAPMPAEADLPASLAALAGLNAVVIGDANFRRDAEALAEKLDAGVAGSPRRPGPTVDPA